MTDNGATSDRILSLAWELWSEIGVAGWSAGRTEVPVDVEALILFTAAIGERDPRLRDESTDWCVQFGRLVSKVRLKTIAKLGIGSPGGFAEYAATVNAHGGFSWPAGAANARPYEPSRRSTLDLSRPALLQLRTRAIFGVAARSEILTFLAVAPDASVTGSELAERIRFGRRMTVEAADLLERSRVLSSELTATARTFRLARRSEIRALLAPLPRTGRSWPSVFRVLWAIWRIGEDRRTRSVAVRAVEARKELTGIDRQAALAGLPLPPRLDTSAAAWADYERWANAILERLGA